MLGAVLLEPRRPNIPFAFSCDEEPVLLSCELDMGCRGASGGGMVAENKGGCCWLRWRLCVCVDGQQRVVPCDGDGFRPGGGRATAGGRGRVAAGGRVRPLADGSKSESKSCVACVYDWD